MGSDPSIRAVVLLDVMMPKRDGYDVCRNIRQTSDTPVILVTARGEDFERIMGLDIGADELTERFIRGDESRTTEGSGLGLSIAKNLTIAQGGEFDIRLDGDLFKVVIVFDCVEQ